MKNTILCLAVFTLLISAPFIISAQTSSFNISLGFGSQNSAEVMRLQGFLVDQGLLNVKPTGNYLSLTQNAVMAFQTAHGIEQTGYFGPLTRAAANKIILGEKIVEPNPGNTPPAVISLRSVSGNGGLGASVILSSEKTINWETSNYPAGVGININLLRKLSDSPVIYTFVRTVAKDTQNDGQIVWTPRSDENSNDLYIEMTCSTTYEFKQGCYLVGTPLKIN